MPDIDKLLIFVYDNFWKHYSSLSLRSDLTRREIFCPDDTIGKDIT
jgi:hypothetical protein